MKDTPAQAMGKRIKELRLKKGYSQEQLAQMSHLDRTYITVLESGRRNLSIKGLARVCHGLDIDLMHFFDSPLFDNIFDED